MSATPIALDQLPRVPGTSLRETRRALVRLGADWDRRFAVTVPAFGTVAIQCLAVSSPEPPGAHDVVWTLASAGRYGYLIVDGLAALRFMSATLGLPAPRVLRALGAGERGVAAAAVAAVLSACARNYVMSLGEGVWQAGALVRLELDLHAASFHERALLDVPLDWIPERPRDLREALEAREIEIGVAVELARTTIHARDWSRAGPGDAVVFDEPALEPQGDLDGAWPVTVACGTFVAAAAIDPRGDIRLHDGFMNREPAHARARVRDPRSNEHTKAEDKDMSSDSPETSSTTVLASAPIEIVAEVGRLLLRADEVVALRPGSVLPLGSLRPTSVDLLIGDRPWARGELVNVDGQLGVRITTLADGAPLTTRASESSDADTVRY